VRERGEAAGPTRLGPWPQFGLTRASRREREEERWTRPLASLGQGGPNDGCRGLS
jgi:hypothetical protein